MGRRELRNTKASPREGEETAENPLPATHPIGHPQGGLLSITLYFSNAGTPASAEASAGIRACVGRYVNKDGWFSGPCLATLLRKLIEIARACNHSS